jgi:hypothetical protein
MRLCRADKCYYFGVSKIKNFLRGRPETSFDFMSLNHKTKQIINMKNFKELSELEKLEMFQVEELESRLELWGDGGNGGDSCCNNGSCNCNNATCNGGGGGGGGDINPICGNEVPIQL